MCKGPLCNLWPMSALALRTSAPPSPSDPLPSDCAAALLLGRHLLTGSSSLSMEVHTPSDSFCSPTTSRPRGRPASHAAPTTSTSGLPVGTRGGRSPDAFRTLSNLALHDLDPPSSPASWPVSCMSPRPPPAHRPSLVRLLLCGSPRPYLLMLAVVVFFNQHRRCSALAEPCFADQRRAQSSMRAT